MTLWLPQLLHKRAASNLLNYDFRTLLVALAGGMPAVVVALLLLWTKGYSAKVQWTLTVVLLLSWLGFGFSARKHAIFPLQTLSNFLRAVNEGDYTLRISRRRHEDSLGEVVCSANTLGDTLREQRLGAMEASALLKQVMAEIDVAILAFDPGQRLCLLNPQAESLLGQSSERVLGRKAEQLHVDELLSGDVPRVVELGRLGSAGRWELRRATFREKGLQHHLVVLSDLTRTLHEEERQAWRRLIQILQHEINNSLAPINSLAETLGKLVCREHKPEDWQEDLARGLDVIAQRSGALNRFMASYARLTRLPRPCIGPVNVDTWVRRVAGLEARMPVAVVPGQDVTVRADSDQLDQLLINLVRNAVDAAAETSGHVKVGWNVGEHFLEVWIEDEGPGLPDTNNLFVPFFTTKPEGAGIGLVISRQIAETHGGTLTLENRKDAGGCRATVRLPLS